MANNDLNGSSHMKAGKCVQIIVFLLLLPVLVPSCAADQSTVKTHKKKLDSAKPVDKYRIETARQVQKNWRFPDYSACSKDSETSIVLSILPNGEIREIFFHKKSNCKDLDDSAYSAVKRSAPFKPFPKELNSDIVKVGLLFSAQ